MPSASLSTSAAVQILEPVDVLGIVRALVLGVVDAVVVAIADQRRCLGLLVDPADPGDHAERRRAVAAGHAAAAADVERQLGRDEVADGAEDLGRALLAAERQLNDAPASIGSAAGAFSTPMRP